MKKFNMKKSVLAVALVATFTTTNASASVLGSGLFLFGSLALLPAAIGVVAPAVGYAGLAALGTSLVMADSSNKTENPENFYQDEVIANSDMTPQEIKGVSGFLQLGMSEKCTANGRKGELWTSLKNDHYNARQKEAIKFKDEASLLPNEQIYMHGGLGGVKEDLFKPNDENSGFVHRKMQATLAGKAHFGFSCVGTEQAGTIVLETEGDGNEIWVDKSHKIHFRQGRYGYSYESVAAFIPLDKLLKMADIAESKKMPAY